MLRRIALHHIPLIGELADRKGRKAPEDCPVLSLQKSCVSQIQRRSGHNKHTDTLFKII